MVLAFLIGLPIPLISLFFLKSTADYLKEDVEVKEEINLEPLEKMITPVIKEQIISQPEERIHVYDNLIVDEDWNDVTEEPKVEEEIKKENIYKEEPVEKINHKETTTVSSSPDMIYDNKIKK